MLTKTAMLESRLANRRSAICFAISANSFAKNVCAVMNGNTSNFGCRIKLRAMPSLATSVYVQEPNLKNGCGGLRDYQNLLWMTFFKEGALTTTHLVGRDWLSEADRKRIEAAYDFLLRLRTDLHYATGRATDTLAFQCPGPDRAATRLPTETRRHLRNEALMKDYYEHTRNIFRVTERITEQFASGRPQHDPFALRFPAAIEKRTEERVDHFRHSQPAALSTTPKPISRNIPEAMMRAFQLAQERQLDLESRASRSLHPQSGSS